MNINPNEKQIVEFDIKVEGASLKEINPRLILHGSNLSLCFDGKIMSGSLKEDKSEFGRFLNDKDSTKCIFEFPVLNEILKHDDGLKQEEVQADIEIILENRYVKAWSSKIKIDRPVVVMMNESKVKVKDNVSISIEPKVITERKIIPKKQKGLYEGKKISIVTKDNVKRNAVITKIIDENKKIVEVKFNNDKKKTIKLK